MVSSSGSDFLRQLEDDHNHGSKSKIQWSTSIKSVWKLKELNILVVGLPTAAIQLEFGGFKFLP
jgi:hypothetical protein